MNRKLLTADGYLKLKEELRYLAREHRPEITKVVAWAASLGDRSENADYHFNKRLLRQIDGRIRHLIKLFEVAEKVEYHSSQEGKVFFGSWVDLENDTGDQLRLRIVGDEEVYWHKNYISLHSPMGKAILGKSVDDEVLVHTPTGIKDWYIKKISYNNLN